MSASMNASRQNEKSRSHRSLGAEPFAVVGVLLMTLLGAACGGSSSPRPDVILITIDTLRTDHIGAYGSKKTRTPNIDQLAEAGMLFTNAATPMPLTRPAHFSLFTSLYPREHGVLNNALTLPEESTTLAERFRAHGYSTAGFVGVVLLAEASGGAQGFDTFGTPSRPKRTADEVIPEALAWVAKQPRDKPFFLWVHLYDPHLPYAPPSEFRSGVNPALEKEWGNLNWKQLKAIAKQNNGDIPRPVLEHAKALYRGEVEFTDYWLGKFLQDIESMRGLDETIVAFTADHGECFENGVYFEHSDCLYDGAISIPLILRHPISFPPGSKNFAQVSLLDIAPTILQAAGLPAPDTMSGKAIQGLSFEEDRYTLLQYPMYQPGAANARSKKTQTIRTVAGQPVRAILLNQEMTGAVGHDWKLLRAEGGPELYEAGSDSSTELNRSETEPETRMQMEETLDTLLREHPMRVLDPALINEEMRRTLEALGYIHDEN